MAAAPTSEMGQSRSSGDVQVTRHVVHGHEQRANGPILKKNRTNLDTFAWYTGRLVIKGYGDPDGSQADKVEAVETFLMDFGRHSVTPLHRWGGTIMLLENPEKVLEKLATSDRITIVIERQPDGKMRVTSASWDGEKVLMRDQVLEVQNATADGLLHIARKVKRHDDWDPPLAPYDPYGPGVTGDAFDVIDD